MFWRKKSSEAETPASAAPVAQPDPAPVATPAPVAVQPAAAAPPAQQPATPVAARPAPQPQPVPAPVAASQPQASPSRPAAAAPSPGSVVPLPRNDKAKQISASFGEIVAVLLRSPSHRKLPLTVLEAIAVPAVMTGQFALAESRSMTHGYQAPVAVVVWACVSSEIDRRLAQDPSQLNKLAQADWKSGDIIWIVDAVGQKEAVRGLIEHLRKDRFAGKQVRYREVTEAKEVVAKIMPT